MKKIFVLFYSVILGLNSLGASAKNVNEKVLQVFKESFPKAEQVIWTEAKGTYTVQFVEEGVRSNITYDENGNFIQSVRYYQEQNLPYYLVVNLKKKYPDKKIFGITELSMNQEIEYYVKLVDAKIWLTLKLDSEGQITMIEKFKKAL